MLDVSAVKIGAEQLIETAVEALRRGLLVAFPTETVYGLGANAGSEQALERLYRVKGRPATHPVIVHIGSVEALDSFAVDIPESAYKLGKAFWPGPLTLVLSRAPHVLDLVTGGQMTVALRVPAHRLALELIRKFAGGVAAPSANRFGRLSATEASHVEAEFEGQVAVVLDGGPCAVGIESTIVDLTGDCPRILRPGMLAPQEIASVLGKAALQLAWLDRQGSYPAVPGVLPVHYAPATPVELVPGAQLAGILGARAASGKRIALLSFGQLNERAAADARLSIATPADPEVYARLLYSNLRKLDLSGADLIVVESPPNEEDWAAIRDRLIRAAGHAHLQRDATPGFVGNGT